jgi:transposase-like protein
MSDKCAHKNRVRNGAAWRAGVLSQRWLCNDCGYIFVEGPYVKATPKHQ